MSNDLVKRLRDHIAVVVDNRGHVFEDEALCDDAADRIEALEAQVAAADALADALSFYADATVEYPNGTVTFQPGDDNGQRAKAALAAYQAAKEGE